jgi:AcrR family transcriptional regulator
MKRKPKSSRAENTRQAILEAATHIVLKEGLEALNTNAVALKAGVSIGSLYQYFNNKDEILLELLTGVVNQRIEKVKTAVTLSAVFESSEEIISRIVDALFEFDNLAAARLEHLLLPLTISVHNKPILEIVKRSEQSIHPLLKLLLTVKEPGLKDRDLEVVSFILGQTVRSVLVGRSLPHGKKIDPEALKLELKRLFLCMVSPQHSRGARPI